MKCPLRSLFAILALLSWISMNSPVALAKGKNPRPSEITQAQARCDLQVKDKLIVGYKNERAIIEFRGRNDRTDRSYTPRDWYAREAQRLKRRCAQYIRKNLASDIISDDGSIILLRHYRCGVIDPMDDYNDVTDGLGVNFYRTKSGRRPYLQLIYREPIYAELTMEEIAEEKCKRLRGCFERAQTSAEIDWVYKMQVQLGCQ